MEQKYEGNKEIIFHLQFHFESVVWIHLLYLHFISFIRYI